LNQSDTVQVDSKDIMKNIFYIQNDDLIDLAASHDNLNQYIFKHKQLSFKTIDSNSQKVMMMDFVDLYDKQTSRKRSMIAMQMVSESHKEQSRLNN
jgi:hypothetical protein